jgi:hypothetical protein
MYRYLMNLIGNSGIVVIEGEAGDIKAGSSRELQLK